MPACTSSTGLDDVSRDPPFREFIGETFVLDAQGLVQFEGGQRTLLALTERVRDFYGLPERIEPAMLGKELGENIDPGITVTQTLPKGTRFRVTGAKFYRVFGGPNHPYLEIDILDSTGQVSGSLVTDALMTDCTYDGVRYDFRFHTGQVKAESAEMTQYTKDKEL